MSIEGIEDASTPTLAQIIREAMNYRLTRVHTCMPARVEKYDEATCLADCTPLVKNRIMVEAAVTAFEDDYPTIPDIPVAWPLGFHNPLAVGDLVVLVISEQCWQQGLANGVQSSPLTSRRHNLADAIAMPASLRPVDIPAPERGYVTLGMPGGAKIHLTPDGRVLLGSSAPGAHVAVGEKVFAELQKLSGVLAALATDMAALSAAGATGVTVTALGLLGFVPATPPTGIWPADVKSTKVEVLP